MMSNFDVILLESAARTIPQNSDDFHNNNRNGGAILTIDVSAIVASPALLPRLQLKDKISGNYKDIWTAAASLIAEGTYAYMFGLGGSGNAGDYTEAVNLLMPHTGRLQIFVTNSDSVTYSAVLTLLS